jgi:hypothetical protein
MKHVSFNDFLNEKKPAGAPKWKDSDAPDAEGRFRDLSIKDLAAWLIKTRDKDLKKISGSLTQQIVFNRNDDPDYAEKMEKTRKEVYRQLGREDLLESEGVLNEIGDSTNPFKWTVNKNVKSWVQEECDKAKDNPLQGSTDEMYTRVSPVEYSFKSDKTGETYYMKIEGLIGRNFQFGRKQPDFKSFSMWLGSSFNVESARSAKVEPETNLGEQYRVLATVTECALDFINTIISIPGLVRIAEFQMNPKTDKEGQAGRDSRRGKLYLAYIEKAFKKLNTREKYRLIETPEGYVLSFSGNFERSGKQIMRSWESFQTFEEFVNEKESPYKEETLQKYKAEYEAGKEIPFGVKTSLIAQGMIPHEGGPDKGKKKKTEVYEAQYGVVDAPININEVRYGNCAAEQFLLAQRPDDRIKNWFIEKGIAEKICAEAPANDSEITRKDMEILIEKMKNATQEELSFAKYVEDFSNLAQSFIDLLAEYGYVETMENFFKADGQTDPTLYFLKDSINRPRPFQLSWYYNMPIRPLLSTDANHASYPSGHALAGFMMSEYYSRKYPDATVELKALGERIANTRELTGIHYPSDTEISREICKIIFENNLLEG